MIVNGLQPLTIIAKPSILDVAVVLDPRLINDCFLNYIILSLILI